MIAEKVQRLMSISLPADVFFTDDALACIKNFAEDPNQRTLIVGLAKNELVASLSNRERLKNASDVSFLLKQKSESIASAEDILSKVMHFSLPMDAKSASLHLMHSTFAQNFIFDDHMWPESKKKTTFLIK